MEAWTQLALQRAGYETLAAFQAALGLPGDGELNDETRRALEPYLTGFRTVIIRPGDTYFRLAREYETTVEALRIANPGQSPERLIPGSRLTVPLGFAIVPTDIPMTAELCRLCIRGLRARYPFFRGEVLTRTAYGRPVEALAVGGGSRVVLYSAAHHANEWITATVLLRFAEELASAAAAGGQIGGYDARQLLRRCTLHLVPMVDPDGVDLVTGALGPGKDGYESARRIAARFPGIPFPDGWKANLTGVDLNLNYPAGWEEARRIKFAQGYTGPAPRDYVGEAPLDQPETKALARYTARINPALVLAYHSQGQEIYWQYQNITVPGAEALGRRMAAVSGYTLADTPYNSSFAGYKDYFILRYRKPGYTVEVGLGENPLPLSQFPEIYRDNLGILTLAMAEEPIFR